MDVNITDVSEQGLSPVQQQVVDATNPTSEYTLENGKKIKFRKPPGIVSMRIAEILGQQSLNPALNIYYRMAFSLVEIDGMAVRSPESDMQIKAVLNRLGDEEAFAESLMNFQEFIGISGEALDQAKK